MRTISLIVIHCSAVTPDQESSAAQIDSRHRKRGWKFGIGYHYVIRRNGDKQKLKPLSLADSRASSEKWRPPTLPHCIAVPSAQAGLTSLFGMGRGGTPPQ